MAIYQRKFLETGENIGEPAVLPEDLRGLLTDADLEHLAELNPAPHYAGQGFFRVADPAPELVIPDTVPMYKARKLLIKQGMMPAVEAALASMQGEAGALARVDWEYAPNLVRLSPLVQGLGAAVGLSPAQIDDLVVAAAALP